MDWRVRSEDPYSSRSLAESPVPVHVVAMLTILNFFNALQVWITVIHRLTPSNQTNRSFK